MNKTKHRDGRQRIVFVNLHGNCLMVKQTLSLIFGKSTALKHRYLLDELLRRPDIEVCTYINSRGCSFVPHRFGSVLTALLNTLRFAEHRYVMRKNNIPRKSITVLRRAGQLRDDDIVVLYCFPHQFTDMEHARGFKVVHLAHLTGILEQKAQEIRRIAPRLLLNESNLFRFNARFSELFGWFDSTRFAVHPFVFEERFRVIKPFSQRRNMAVSVGTIARPSHDGFARLYGSDVIQPMRKEIKESAVALHGIIECHNHYYGESADRAVHKTSDNIFAYMRKQLHDARHIGQQREYFSFDMTEMFNDFRMCVVGEEITGIPGIGFVEGMACGCAYIGLDNGMYEQYGLQEGVHYIGYDGTLAGLRDTVIRWQRPENQLRLEEIAAAGCEYVRRNFNRQSVAAAVVRILTEARAEKNRK